MFTNLFAVAVIGKSSFHCSLINNALDGTEDDAVWDDEEEETEDADETFDNEFETDSEAEDDEWLSSAEL